MKDKIYTLIASFGYLGFTPQAPGTSGTAGALVLYLLLLYTHAAHWGVLLICLLLCAAGNILIGEWAESRFGGKDPQQVVIDEAAGYFLTVILFAPSIWVALSGFVLFRFFDIVKLYPTRKLEACPAGWGILLDDLMAGIYAALVMVLVSFWWSGIRLLF